MHLDAVLAHRFEPITQAWTWRDSALYALALGIGSDPLDADELPYVYEGYNPAGAANHLRAVPSRCVTLGWLRLWQADPAFGIAWHHILHGEMRFTLHRPLPVEGAVVAMHRVVAVSDKGPARGAVLHLDKLLHDAASGEPLATLRSVEFLRGDGGCGDWSASGEPQDTLPPLPGDFEPDLQLDFPTVRQAALLYRLASGDLMPIHADPAVARRAGFGRPISHGLNNLGLACRAVLKAVLPGRPEALLGMGTRFVQPGLPGDTVRVQLQRRGGQVLFRALAVERHVLLLDRGYALLGA